MAVNKHREHLITCAMKIYGQTNVRQLVTLMQADLIEFCQSNQIDFNGTINLARDLAVSRKDQNIRAIREKEVRKKSG